MSNFLTEALDKALKTFGTYHYEDKGAHEVMDVNALVQRLVLYSPEEVKELLDTLQAHEHGEVLYNSLWSALIEDEEYPLPDELEPLLSNPFEGGAEPVEVQGHTFQDVMTHLLGQADQGGEKSASEGTTADEVDLEQRMHAAFTAYMAAGQNWSEASVNFLEAKIRERFPTAASAELTVILDENYTEHSIRVYDGNGTELTADQDFPSEDEEAEDWWLLASEGAVFAEGETVTILLGDQ